MPESSSATTSPLLLVGLGNPGSKYEQTRHNIGFEAIDALARHWQIPIASHRKFQADYGEGQGTSRQRVRLLKPQTYMNASGQSVRAVVDWFNLSPQSVLLIYDDLDLPVGKIRLRLAGSAGGHNGVRSVISHLGTQEFPRLRIGIGAPKEGDSAAKPDTVSYVLGRFTGQERSILTTVLTLVTEAVEFSLVQGIEKAMSRYNSQTVADPTAR